MPETMRIELVDAGDDRRLERVADVMLQLRASFDRATLIARMAEQQESGYRLACVEADDEILSVAGFVIASKLAWGRHLYVDDLVTAERHRSKGAGGRLLEWLKDYARNQGCAQMHLDSGVQRFAAHRFYLRHGFDIASHHFSMTDLAG